MAKPDLVFVTNENEKKITDMAERGEGARCKSCGLLVGGPHECTGPFVSELNSQEE